MRKLERTQDEIIYLFFLLSNPLKLVTIATQNYINCNKGKIVE